MFDFLTGTKRPSALTPVVPAAELRQRLLAAPRPTAPWHVVAGSQGVDLVAEWRIVDAKWYVIFAKAGLKKVFRIEMKLDEAAHEVRNQDVEYEVTWRAGVPTVRAAASGFRGKKKSVEIGAGYGFTEDFGVGQQYKYRFATSEIEDPLQQVVLAAGWAWKPVAFGKL